MNTTCPKCKGEGKIRSTFRQNGYDQVVVACTFCNGSGKRPYYTGPR